jgi:putative ABC transport system ATP-binding protein
MINNEIIRLVDVKRSFLQGDKKIEVLKGVDFSLEKGETAAILGQSGSGKSTLLSLLSGIDRPNEGEITFEGSPFSQLNDNELAKLRSHKIGIIFQQFHLLPHLKAWENVSLAMEIKGESGPKKKAFELLEKVSLGHRSDHYPSQLSGGEKQRVAIARSLSLRPHLLLADEPSGSLDEGTGNGVMKLLFDLVKESRMSLILVTHNKSLAQYCHRTLVLDKGHLAE